MERAAKDRQPAISNSAGVKNSSVPELFLPLQLLADSDACIHGLGCWSGKEMCLPAWKLGRVNAGANPWQEAIQPELRSLQKGPLCEELSSIRSAPCWQSRSSFSLTAPRLV